MRKTRVIIIGLVLTALLLAIPLVMPVIPKANSEKIAVSSQEEKEEPLTLSGEVRAEKQIELKFKSSGTLVWVGVKEGDRVKKGQLIAYLDKRELEKRFQKEINDYLSERWDFEQTQDDYKSTKERALVTDTIKRILEKAQFDLDSSVLETEIAKLAVEYSNLISPIDGIVIYLDQPIAGVNVTPTTATFTVADSNSVYFEAEIDEEEVSKVKEGDKGKIVLDAYPEQEFDSEIKTISFAPIPGKTSTSYKIKMPLPENTDLRFRLGMNGEVTIEQ